MLEFEFLTIFTCNEISLDSIYFFLPFENVQTLLVGCTKIGHGPDSAHGQYLANPWDIIIYHHTYTSLNFSTFRILEKYPVSWNISSEGPINRHLFYFGFRLCYVQSLISLLICWEGFTSLQSLLVNKTSTCIPDCKPVSLSLLLSEGSKCRVLWPRPGRIKRPKSDSFRWVTAVSCIFYNKGADLYCSLILFLQLTGHQGFLNAEVEMVIFFFFFWFLGLHLQHMEIPRLGIKSELQLLAYTTATAMPDPRQVCDLTPQLTAMPDP